MFSLDATVLTGSSLLVVTLPALWPAALILMVAGIVAYMAAESSSTPRPRLRG